MEDVETGSGLADNLGIAIEDMVRRIVQRCSPQKVILFGSHARGEADAESDVDLMVLFREIDNPRQRAAELYRLLSEGAFPKDIVVSTTARFERYKNVPNTVYWPAAREGKVLYERSP
jgi:predicted nucleotidyltransferase